MTPLLPTKARPVRLQPAINPYHWLSTITLSPDELKILREHVERSLQLADGEVIR